MTARSRLGVCSAWRCAGAGRLRDQGRSGRSGQRGAAEEAGVALTRASAALEPGPGAGIAQQRTAARKMDHFTYRGGVLHAEDVPLPEIAAAVGTPVYVYSAATLTRHYRVFQEALAGLDHLICYAVKANSNLAVLALMGALGAGMDVVSRGRVPAGEGGAGCRASASSSPGVGKTRDEMRLALDGGIRQFNVESEPELRALSEVARAHGRGRADRAPGQPRRRRADPRQDRHRQGGEQVRHPDRAGARGLCRGGAAAGDRGGRHRRAYRQPAHRARALRGGLRQGGGADGGAARRRPRHPPARPRRRPRHPLPAQRTRRRRCRSTTARWCGARSGISAARSRSSRGG